MTDLDLADLDGFTGTEEWHRHRRGPVATGVLYTDGVLAMAEKGAYWLIDAIASHQPKARRRPELKDFQLWTLKVRENKSARLECRADSDRPVSIYQEIEYTDFAPAGIKLYLRDNVLMLPSEY